jgi:hypothetical protein
VTKGGPTLAVFNGSFDYLNSISMFNYWQTLSKVSPENKDFISKRLVILSHFFSDVLNRLESVVGHHSSFVLDYECGIRYQIRQEVVFFYF